MPLYDVDHHDQPSDYHNDDVPDFDHGRTANHDHDGWAGRVHDHYYSARYAGWVTVYYDDNLYACVVTALGHDYDESSPSGVSDRIVCAGTCAASGRCDCA